VHKIVQNILCSWRCCNTRDVTYKDTVEYCRFLDRAGSERIILALEGPKGYRRVRSGTVFYGFDVFSLLFLASQIASIRGTRVREKSSRTASVASEESVGRRAEPREVSCAEFQLPRQNR